MVAFSDYLENKIIDHILRNQAYTPPSTVYMALYTAAPTDAGGGTEVNGGSYARQGVGLSVASGGASSNVADITFPTATGDWGTIVACSLMDALTNGNFLMWSNLDENRTVNNGNTFRFNAGNLAVVAQ